MLIYALRIGEQLRLERVRQFAGDVIGGTVGALMIVPIILSCGVVSYQNLGPGYVSAGIMAAFVAAILSAVIAGLVGGQPLHVNSPKTSHAAILSSLIAVIATHLHSLTITLVRLRPGL